MSGFVAGFGGSWAVGLGAGVDLLLHGATGAHIVNSSFGSSPDSSSSDRVDDKTQSLSCELNPDALNCQEDEPNDCK